MPYRDPQKSRDYQREYRRMRRAGDQSTTPCTTVVPITFRLATARDVLELIEEQVEAVRAEPEVGTLEKAHPGRIGPASHGRFELCLDKRRLGCGHRKEVPVPKYLTRSKPRSSERQKNSSRRCSSRSMSNRRQNRPGSITSFTSGRNGIATTSTSV